MLIDFSVTNYRSIHARQTLSMAATPAFKELAAHNTIDSGLGDKSPKLLRSAVLYGPNASGKSTLIQALSFMRDRVLNSQKESQAGDEIETVPFKLSAASRKAISEFEIAFVEQGVRYEYGFNCTRQRFTEEWLFAYPMGRAQKWFHRVLDESTGQDQYKFSTLFDGDRKRQDWVAQTRPNALFVSTAIQLNNIQLQPIFNWFKEKLQVISSAHGLSAVYSMRKCKSQIDKNRIVDFMNSAGLSLADLQVDVEIFSAEKLPSELPTAFKDELTRQMSGKEVLTLRYIHHDTETGAPIEFEENEESDGTRALFAFSGPWLDMMENERVLVVDELDTSLHPLLVQHLVTLLHHQVTRAQLIFTTHDTTLLSQKLLRRDQVWFMEKDDSQATRLYPLSDFSPRENEAIERGYLNGRYGGIPFLKDLDYYGV